MPYHRNNPRSAHRGLRLTAETLETREVLASLAGHVFHDVNSTYQLDGNDTGIAGVTVQLVAESGKVIFTETDASGGYRFDDLAAGDYDLFAGEVAGLLGGIAEVGTGGGQSVNSHFESISLRGGDAVSGYNFGQLSPAKLTGYSYLDFDRDGNFDDGDTGLADTLVVMTGVDIHGNEQKQHVVTTSDGHYEFDGLLPGDYSLWSEAPKGYVDGRETLGTFDDYGHSIEANGTLSNDAFKEIHILAGQAGRNYNFGEFDPRVNEGTLATTFKESVVFRGSSADDHFEFIAGGHTHRVLRNGVLVGEIDASVPTRVFLYTYGGTDKVDLVGGSGVDQAELRNRSAKLTGVSYQVLVYSSYQTTVQSGGGEDRAIFYDTRGSEHFVANPTGATIKGDGFEHTANDFHRVYAYATKGTDTAALTGSHGDDRYKATATDARLYGDGYYNYVRGFDVVEGDALDGADDRAYFYDSTRNDVYFARGDESRMYGNGFDNRSDNFDRVYAYSTGGNDTAVFYDTEGSDYFKVDGHGARLYGDGYYNRAIQFRSHYTYFTAGDGVDQVWFGDSAEDDTILARRNMFMAWRNGAYFRVFNPDHVEARASVGRDVARLYSNFEFTLNMQGAWQSS